MTCAIGIWMDAGAVARHARPVEPSDEPIAALARLRVDAAHQCPALVGSTAHVKAAGAASNFPDLGTRMSTVRTFARARSNGRPRSRKASSPNARPKLRCAGTSRRARSMRPPSPSSPTTGGQAHGSKTRSQFEYLYPRVLEYFAGKRARDITPDIVDAFLDHLAAERRLSASSVNHHRTIVNGVFNFGRERRAVRQESGRSGEATARTARP